jgi:hypothetical protein
VRFGEAVKCLTRNQKTRPDAEDLTPKIHLYRTNGTEGIAADGSFYCIAGFLTMEFMASEFTRPGTAMEGFDYECIVALEKITDYLEHPDSLRGFYLEEDEYKHLDDIVLLHSNGDISAIQVKCAMHPESPEDAWDWDDLLNRPKGATGQLKNSLLMKWSHSLELSTDSQTSITGLLETNRRASDGLAALIHNTSGYIVYDSIPAEIQAAIEDQLGGKDAALRFFGRFAFRFDQLGTDEREAPLRSRLRNLNLSDIQIDSLKREIWKWMKFRAIDGDERPIVIDDVKVALEWRSLRRVNERFTVPTDYVEPPQSLRDRIENAISASQQEGNCLVVVGTPGSGKSTYFSQLVTELSENGRSVIRHHFFLSLKDTTRRRVSFHVSAESLMWQLQRETPEHLGQLAEKNPSAQQLGEWITTAGKSLSAEGSSLTVIVDGLDHVWREKRSIQELEALLDELLPVPDGVTLILGTQPLSPDRTPLKLARMVSQEDYIELPAIDRHVCAEWFRQHLPELGVVADGGARRSYLEDALCDAFADKSGGHPLTMRYMLESLRRGSTPVTREIIVALPDCPEGDIGKYYDSLLHSASGEAIEILFLLCAAGYSIPRSDIFRILDPKGTRMADLAPGYHEVEHLLSVGPLGIRPFHSSLAYHVKQTPTYTDFESSLNSSLSAWLVGNAPRHWRWTYATPFLLSDGFSLDEMWDWAIDGIVRKYDIERGTELLVAFAGDSLAKDDVYATVSSGILKDYIDAALRRPELLERLLPAQLYLQDDEYLVARLEESMELLSEAELVILAEWADRNGRPESYEHSVNQLISILRRPDRTVYRSDRLGGAKSYLRVAAVCPSFPAQQIAKFIVRNRDHIDAVEAIEQYSRTASGRGNIHHLHTLLDEDLTDEERRVVCDEINLAFLAGVSSQPCALQSPSPLLGIIDSLRNNNAEQPTSYGFPCESSLLLSGYEVEENRRSVARFFQRAFLAMVGNELVGNPEANQDWLQGIGKHSWQRSALHTLGDMAAGLAEAIAGEVPLEFSWPFAQMSHLTRPTFSEREAFYFAKVVDSVLHSIGNLVVFLRRWFGGTSKLGVQELLDAEESAYFNGWAWIAETLNHQMLLPDRNSAESWISSKRSEILTWWVSAEERADSLSQLSHLGSLLYLRDSVSECTSDAARHLLAYGSHKDMMLFQTLAVIRRCLDNGVNDSVFALHETARRIARIDDLTDGDETAFLPKELSQLLARVSPELLLKYYMWLVDAEQFNRAEYALSEFIQISDLSDPVQRALVATAVDDRSLECLADLAENDDGEEPYLLDLLSSSIKPTEKDEKDQGLQSEIPRSVSQSEFPNPGDFTAEEFGAYLAELGGVGFGTRVAAEGVREWIRHWCDRLDCRDVVDAVAQAAKNGYLGHGFSYQVIYKYVLDHLGSDAALPWLVMASQSAWGWNEWASHAQGEKERWELVNHHHPDNWKTYLCQCLFGGLNPDSHSFEMVNRIARIAGFFTYFEQIEHLGLVLSGTLDSLVKLTSTYEFDPLPWWPQ